MELKKREENEFHIVEIEGRVDATNYNEFETAVSEILNTGVKQMIINCKSLNYISSSGLRIFLITQKKTNASRLQIAPMRNATCNKRDI